jgi:uncharacterized protein YllA (UPF0747 family)
LLADVFERQRELARALEDRSQQLLASGYHVQVHQGAGSTMLFMERNGSREGLRVDGEQLHVGDHQVSRKEIIRELKERPELFSPSALLRPVVQDTLLPTAVHVTGPAETAYLAQSGAIYELLQRPRPVVRPRVSATILDARARRLLEKYGISVEDLWKENTEELLARRSLPADLESSVTALQRRVEADFATLASRIAQLDPTLVDATTTAGNKIRHQFEQLQGRVERSFARHSQDLQRHAAHLSGSLYPNHLLQERVLSAAEWHLKYPDTFLPTIVEKLSVDCPDHQLIAL